MTLLDMRHPLLFSTRLGPFQRLLLILAFMREPGLVVIKNVCGTAQEALREVNAEQQCKRLGHYDKFPA